MVKMSKDYEFFFYPEISSFLSAELRNKISVEYEKVEDFESKRKKGENQEYLCEIIRNDLIDDFVYYVNKNDKFPLSKIIKPSLFETNPFLIKNDLTLIEYAAFYGSIQIFKYLFLNQVDIEPKLYLCTIHSKNAEIIHYLEEYFKLFNEVENDKCLIESIKCHHNDFAEYFRNNYEINPENIWFYLQSLQSYNFASMKELKENEIPFFFMCKQNYFKFVDHLLSTTNISTSFMFQKKTPFHIAYEKTNFEILDMLIEKRGICPKAFSNCNLLESFVIPDTIDIINYNAFSFCQSLVEIEIPSSVKYISSKAFYMCSSLKEITIPDAVTYIGDFCFNGCSSLKKIIVPYMVKYVGKNAFEKCTSLEKVALLSPL